MVISAPGFCDAETKRDRPRWAKNVIGPMSSVAIIRGHIPPAPAFMGRKRMPAPTAVPNNESVQLDSKRPRLWWEVSAPAGFWLVASFGPVISCVMSTLHFFAATEHNVTFVAHTI